MSEVCEMRELTTTELDEVSGGWGTVIIAGEIAVAHASAHSNAVAFGVFAVAVASSHATAIAIA